MLRITRRDFIKYCSVAAGALGLSASTMMKLDKVLAKDVSDNGLPVVWISGAACTGCTVSLANSRFYTTVDDVLLNMIDLRYLDTLMAAAGAIAGGSEVPGTNSLTAAHDVYNNLPFVLAVEGGIPVGTPTSGNAGDYCNIGELVPGDTDATMLNVVRKYAAKAAAILAIGTCSSFGGVPGARGNVTNCRGLLYQQNRINRGALNDPNLGTPITTPVINISGCPPHPDWIVGTIAHVLDTLGSAIEDVLGVGGGTPDVAALVAALPAVTSYNRPMDYGYAEYQCNSGPCPWRYNNTTNRAKNTDPYGDISSGVADTTGYSAEPDWNRRYPVGNSMSLGKNKWTVNNGTNIGCLGILGCKGRKTKADCSRRRWNTDQAEEYGVNWCVGSRGNCHGCTEPAFPDRVGKFYTFR